MELIFLGTGSWDSENRKSLSLYAQIDDRRILFECPSHVLESLEALQLPVPEAVFITHSHPEQLSLSVLDQLLQENPGLKHYIATGANVRGVSIRSHPVLHSNLPTVGYSLTWEGTKLLAFVPESSNAPNALFQDASHAVLYDRDLYYAQSVLCNVANISLVPTINPWARTPEDGDRISILDHTIPGVHVPVSLAESLRDGAKTLVVKSRPFLAYTRRPLYAFDRRGVWAKIVLSVPREIGLDTFQAREQQHLITDSLRAQLWPSARTLYAFKVRVYEKYDPPLDLIPHEGFRTFIPNIQLKARTEPIIEIEDLETYDPSKNTRLQRRDDWRILVAHYSKILTGKRTPWPRALIEQKAVQLCKALTEDGVVFHPDTMSQAGKQLFQKVLRSDSSIPHTLTKKELSLSAPEIEALSLEKLKALHRNLHLTWDAGEKTEAVANLHYLVISASGGKITCEGELAKSVKAEEIQEASIPFALPPLTLVHEAVNLVGSRVHAQGTPNDIDLLFRSAHRLPAIEAQIAKLFNEECHVILAERGPNWQYIPLGDLVILPTAPGPVEIEQVPEDFSELRGLKPILVQESYLTLNDQSIHVAGPNDSGLLLKLQRISACEVCFESMADSKKVLGDLWFIPYTHIRRVNIPWDEAFMARVFRPESLQAGFRPGVPFTPLKAKSGYHVGEFYSVPDIIKLWATAEKLEQEIVVQPKADGIRLVIHKKGNSVKIFTEDKKRDRAKILPTLVEAVRQLKHDVILDTETLEYDNGNPAPRHEMVGLVVGKSPPTRRILAWVHDCVYLDKDISELPYRNRLEILENLELREILRPMPTKVVKTHNALRDALAWAGKQTQLGSEGAMLKTASSPYAGERSPNWAKYKQVSEIKVRVIGIAKKPNPWPGQKPRELEGPKAIAAYRKLTTESQTYLIRGAILGPGGRLVPIEADKKLAPGDFNLRWTEGKEWRGTESPEIWTMTGKFGHRKPGDLAYGTTYAKKLEPAPKLGDIVTVRPMGMRFFTTPDGRQHLAWMFPTLTEIDPTRDRPDTWVDARRIVKSTTARRQAELPKSLATSLTAGIRVDMTRDEMRKAAKKRMGHDFYVVRQPPDRTSPFVLQYHCRGILGPDQLKASRKELETAEDAKALARIWKRWSLVQLAPGNRDALARLLSEVDDKRGDVSSALRKFADTKPPASYNPEHTWALGNAHLDLRILHPNQKYLVGWTVNTAKIVLQPLAGGKLWFPLRDRFLLNQDTDQWLAQQKASQPIVWSKIVSPRTPYYWREPGDVGATSHAGACFIYASGGQAIYGVQKSEHYHEYFLRFDNFGPIAHHSAKDLSGRWDFKKLPARPEYKKVGTGWYWQGSRPWRTQYAYITTHDQEQETAKERKAKREWVWNETTLKALGKLFGANTSKYKKPN